jgi:hypothetical protein
MKQYLSSVFFLVVIIASTSVYSQTDKFYFKWQTIDNSKYPDIAASFSILDPNYRIAVVTDVDTSTSFIDSETKINLTHKILLPMSAQTRPDRNLIDTTLTNVNVVVNDGLALMVMIDNSASAKLAYGSNCVNLKQLLHSMLNVLSFPKNYVTFQLFNADGVSIGLSKANDYNTISNYIDNIDNVIGNGNFTEHGYVQAVINPTNGFKWFLTNFDTSYHIGHFHGLIVSGSTPSHPYIDEPNSEFGGEGADAYRDLRYYLGYWCGLMYIADPATNAFWTDNYPVGTTMSKGEESDTGTYKLRFFNYPNMKPTQYYNPTKNDHPQRWGYNPNDNASFFSTLWYNFQCDANVYQASEIEHQATFTVPVVPTENTVLVQNAQYGILDTLHIMNISLDVKQSSESKTISLYPNPATHFIMISGGKPDEVFSLIDTKGEAVATGIVGQIMSVGDLADGVYQILIQGKVASRVVIVH